MQPLPGPFQLPALLAALALVLLASLAAARLLRIERTLPLLLAVAILSCAQVVVAVEALSLAHRVGAGPLLGVHALGLLVLLAAGARPAPLRPRARLAALRSDLRTAGSPAVVLLLATTAASAVVLAWQAVAVPPNTYDGLQYHLTRAFAYLQQGSLDAYPTPDLRETVLAAGAEMLLLWPLAFWPQPYTPGLVQLLAWLGAGAAVYGVARRSAFAPGPAALAGLVFMALPAAILQASSTQVDLVTAFFVIAAFYFAAAPRGRELLLCGLALGLAIGTKTTAAFAVPGFAAWAVLAAVRAERELPRRVRRLAAVGAACLCGFALCGAYIHVQNLRRYGHPSGPPAFREAVVPARREPRVIWSNAGRLAIRLADPGGSAPPGSAPARWLHAGYDRLARAAMGGLAIRASEPADFGHESAGWSTASALAVDEDVTLFGVAFAPLLAAALLQALRRRHVAALLLLGSAAVYLLILAAALRWQIWNGRFLMTFGVLAAPSLAAAFSGRGAAVLSLLAALASAGSQYVCVLHNAHKPLVGAAAIRHRSRVERLRLEGPGREVLLRLLDARRPPVRRLALFASIGDLRSPLYGERLERSVVAQRARPGAPASLAVLDGFDAVLLTGPRQSMFREGPAARGPASFWEEADLRPLLAALREPGSGWRPVVQSPWTGALFVRAASPAGAYPPDLDRVRIEGEWGDTWIGPRFATLVRAEGAEAVEVEGELLDIGALGARTCSIGRGGEAPSETRTIAPGPFRLRLDLGAPDAAAPEFVAVEVRCAPSYNPFAAGVSGDNRDLGWRLRAVNVKRADARGSAG